MLIAYHLGFKYEEIASIESSGNQNIDAFISGVIWNYIQWEPRDHRGSKEYPMLESLQKAIDRSNIKNLQLKLD